MKPRNQYKKNPMGVIRNRSRQTLIITYCDGQTCNLSHDLAVFLNEKENPGSIR